jgi:hypothetical protein
LPVIRDLSSHAAGFSTAAARSKRHTATGHERLRACKNAPEICASGFAKINLDFRVDTRWTAWRWSALNLVNPSALN